MLVNRNRFDPKIDLELCKMAEHTQQSILVSNNERSLPLSSRWYEDLMSPEVDQTLKVRLENEDCDIKLSNGKLMERLLTFKVSETLWPALTELQFLFKTQAGAMSYLTLFCLQMIREDISLSNVEWEWNEQTETLTKRVRKPDPSLASFYSKLLPIAQNRIQSIRCVAQRRLQFVNNQSWLRHISSLCGTQVNFAF